AIAIVERHDAFERAITRRNEVGAGIHRQHTRHGAGRVGTDPTDNPVRMAAAHHHRIGLAGQRNIVGETAVPTHERWILAAGHRLADAELGYSPGVGVVLQVHEAKIPHRAGFDRLPKAVVARQRPQVSPWPASGNGLAGEPERAARLEITDTPGFDKRRTRRHACAAHLLREPAALLNLSRSVIWTS